MLHSKYYQGLPDEIWDDLTNEVEEVLREEEIGTHIVGVYPSGSRIYGKESSSPEFICLHIDSPEVILNPSIIHHPDNDTGYWSNTIKLDGSRLTFIHLFDWVQWLLYRKTEHSIKLKKLHDFIPCNQDIAYQDESINDLILMARDFISYQRAFCSRNNDKLSYDEKLEYCLYARTQLLIEETGRFSPNINPNWDKVFDIKAKEGSDLYEIDKLIQETVVENNKRVIDRDMDVYSWEIWKKLHPQKINNPFFIPGESHLNPEIINLANKISKETMKIYRYIL